MIASAGVLQSARSESVRGVVCVAHGSGRKPRCPGERVAHGDIERVLWNVAQWPAWRLAPGVSPDYKKPLYSFISPHHECVWVYMLVVEYADI
uniref:Uncharacterized protein n=1 Tax=Oryza rufipogon TaxID=4529 RepID=A0A0E0Q1S9_ORYRU